MTDEQKALERKENIAKSKEVAAKVLAKTPDSICPMCKNMRWLVVYDGKLYPTLLYPNLTGIPTYSLTCTNCGFVRQHIKSIVDGERVGEVVFARSRNENDVG